MSKTKDLFEKISKNPELLNKFRNIKDFEEFYSLCREIVPDITKEEIDINIKALINKITKKRDTMQISDVELEEIAGGRMDFNKFKVSTLTTLVALGGIATVTELTKAPVYAVSAVSSGVSSNISQREQNTLNWEFSCAARKRDFARCEEILKLGADY